MARTEILDPFTPIQKVPLYTQGGLQSSMYSIVLDPDGESKEVGTVSSEYNLVPNDQVVNIAEELIDMLPGGVFDPIDYFNGKVFRRRYVLEADEFGFDVNPSVGDVVKMTLDVLNSYDGSTKFGLAFNMFRLACSNGMIVSQRLGGFRFKHNRQDNDALMKEIDRARSKMMNVAEFMHNLIPSFHSMIVNDGGLNRVQEVFATLQVSDAIAGKALQYMESTSDWGILNGLTAVYSEEGSGIARDGYNRRAMEFFLNEHQ
jgi:hypothetical protein